MSARDDIILDRCVLLLTLAVSRGDDPIVKHAMHKLYEHINNNYVRKEASDVNDACDT